MRACLAAKTVNYCNCMPRYNYTQDGNTFTVNNGTCIRTSASELPWCFVIEDTCITPVLHRAGLGKNDSAWDTCLTTSEPLLMSAIALFQPSDGTKPKDASATVKCEWQCDVSGCAIRVHRTPPSNESGSTL